MILLKRKLSLILCMVLYCLSVLSGCGQQTLVQQIPYDPYGFTPKQFYEEGGWNAAKNLMITKLPQIYCETNNIVIDGGKYEPILTVSGNTYDFSNAKIMTALYVHNVADVNKDTETQSLNNWLDFAMEIPIKDSSVTSKLIVRMKNITRTEDGNYVCVSISGVNNSVPLYTLQQELSLNTYYIVNDGVVKEPLDYGIMEWIEDDYNYSQVGDAAKQYEEDRITAYLLALENNNSLYFTTAEYKSCDTADYTVNYNASEIIADLNSFTHSFGMQTSNYDDFPRKKNGKLNTKQIKKDGWIEQDYSYLTTDEGQTVQEFCRTVIRNQYFASNKSQFVFYTEKDEETNVVSLIMWIRVVFEDAQSTSN